MWGLSPSGPGGRRAVLLAEGPFLDGRQDAWPGLDATRESERAPAFMEVLNLLRPLFSYEASCGSIKHRERVCLNA